MEAHINDFLNKLLIDKKISKTQLAECLHISNDTLYKRLTQGGYSVSELMLISEKFKISPNELLQVQQSAKLFDIKKIPLLDTPVATIDAYIQDLYTDLQNVYHMGVSQIYYAAKDLPLFAFFSSPQLASFKLYFWHITLFDAQTKHMKYDANWLPATILNRANEIYELYNKCNSTEIWNYETFNSTLHQIKYCKEIGLLSGSDAKELQNALLDYVDVIEQQCMQSTKANKAAYTLYLNEILLLDNTVIFDLGATKVFYLPYQTLNFLRSIDNEFTTNGIEWIDKQIKKSLLISGHSEKEREKLMNHYRGLIEACV
jgi:DNA-binding Xre family transcriptional regulator